MERGECRVGLRRGKWPTYSQALHGRAEQAPPLREKRRRRRKFQISDLRFQIEETATARANSRTPRANTAHGAPANTNADPSPLKGIRDDGGKRRPQQNRREDYWPLFSRGTSK